MRQRDSKLKLLAAMLAGGSVLANASCLSKRFVDDIATDAARDLANILIDALLIDPVDEAVND